MNRIAVLGLGAMGARMAANLLKAGFDVTVWNRTPSTADALVAAGATCAATPKEAAQNADFVMAMVRDDAASREVWLDEEVGALAGMKPGAIAIESSTLTPQWIRELGAALESRDVELLEAPVSGSRPQAEAAQLVYLLGGDAQTVARCEHVLKAMGSSLQHVGALGSGALVKLATNALMGVQITALAELIGLLKHAGADVPRALEALSATPAWSAVAQRNAGLMLGGNFAPLFPVELIEKDFGYALGVDATQTLPTLDAAREVFRAAIERGWGKDNMTGVVRLFNAD